MQCQRNKKQLEQKVSEGKGNRLKGSEKQNYKIKHDEDYKQSKKSKALWYIQL
jgi:hypothetical protein